MKRKDLDKIAKSFFDRNEDLKEMFATESGHFFYIKSDRDNFMLNSEKSEKAVNYTKAFFAPEQDAPKQDAPKQDAPKEFNFKECPAGEILKKRGFKSVAELKAADLSKVQGLGPKKAEEIKDYLKNFD